MLVFDVLWIYKILEIQILKMDRYDKIYRFFFTGGHGSSKDKMISFVHEAICTQMIDWEMKRSGPYSWFIDHQYGINNSYL